MRLLLVFLGPLCACFSHAADLAHAADMADIVPTGAVVERVATGLGFVEGPTWMAPQKVWLFSDIPTGRIYRLDHQLTLAVAFDPSYHSNGNRSDLQGNRYTCEQDGRLVSATAADGTRRVLTASFNGKAFNSPNDCALAADGSVWFTDPDYGLGKRPSEQPVHGVYRLAAGASEPTLVAADFVQPNGICFSPDGATCYIADSGTPHHVRAFTVDHAQLSGGRIFAVITPGVPDGMRCDRAGRLYVTAGNGVQVFSPDGTRMGLIPVDKEPANCAFGDEDGKTLLITARSAVYRIRLLVAGLP
jgi:gluconolactonase